MKKNSLKRIFAALALSAVATTSVASISAFAEEGTTEAPTETVTEAPTEEDTEAPTEAPTAAGPSADGGFTADEIAAAPVKATITMEKKSLTVAEAAGKEVTLTYSVNVGNWASTGVHIDYDSRLELTAKKWSDAVNDNESIGAKKFQEYTNGLFVTTAADADTGITGTIVTLTFKVPSDAKAGDFYPVTFNYVPKDLFTNAKDDETGKLMQAYTFTQGLVGGGIQIVDDATAAPTTVTTAKTTTTAKATTVTTTTAKAGTTTTASTKKTESPKTGVAGVGVAAAGLVVAAGAAFVLRKKED